MSRPLYCVGDPHGDFAPILALADRPVGDVVIVGDLQLQAPIQEVLAPLFNAGFGVHFIMGNHDAASCAHMDFLTGPKGGHPDGDLHGRVVDLGGMKVAGLGGVFKGRVWAPGKDPAYATRGQWMQQHRERWRGGLPVHLRDAIFMEDFEGLARQRADILFCHEGPSSVWRDMGWADIDQLAHCMGCKLIVHGHHHHQGSAVLPNGVGVRSLGKTEIWELPRS